MRTKFYEDLINSLDKVVSTTLDEKHDKADAIIAVTKTIRKRGGAVRWNGKKWKVTVE